MRLLKNKTQQSAVVSYENVSVEIPANGQVDLSEIFEPWQLASSESLLQLLAQGEDKFQLNDGQRDLTLSEAVDLVRGYYQKYNIDSDNRIRTSVEPRKVGSGLVVVTHNWCDPTTWYQKSQRVLNETLVDSGDGKTFTSAHAHWIDLTHGKIYRENLIAALYVPIVKVDGVTKTERAAWESTGGDYVIDYANGQVLFFESQAGKTVTADYSYATSSLFIIAPAPGKRLWVEYSEVQFSEDVDICSTVHFQPWAFNPQNPQYKIPVAAPTTYKTLDNYIEEANGCYPPVPPMGKTRGFLKARYTFPFKYQTIKELSSNYGVEIRIWLENDIPFGGEYSTATFYCTSYDL